ncbi:MAG: hypothetical protein K2I34_07515, partial [Paramuribaculum sp.]|nr:hypothetical protein [Paramuribaculum sp.]
MEILIIERYLMMDTKIEKKSRFSTKRIVAMVFVVAVLIVAVWLMTARSSSTMNVDKNSVTIATVTKGEFNDYIRVAGRVIPDKIVYL